MLEFIISKSKKKEKIGYKREKKSCECAGNQVKRKYIFHLFNECIRAVVVLTKNALENENKFFKKKKHIGTNKQNFWVSATNMHVTDENQKQKKGEKLDENIFNENFCFV